jgi:ring-1,2-phenylacetyl-CoA epoxidase subunit PaaD
MVSPSLISVKEVEKVLASVCDPEVPVLSILDLGIVRDIAILDSKLVITITPTYSGCPAMDAIQFDMRLKLLEAGYQHFDIKTVLSPAWTTDWMSEEGKKKLLAYGIAPPNPKQQVCTQDGFIEAEAIECPHCHSSNTRMVSEFGSTACKSLYQCLNCREPFDYFKCH